MIKVCGMWLLHGWLVAFAGSSVAAGNGSQQDDEAADVSHDASSRP